MKFTFSLAALFALLTLVGGCSRDLAAHADALAQPAGLRHEQIKTGTFILTAYEKVGDPAQPFDIYIEGDGFAWQTEYEPSANPTPRKALTLALAARDPSPNVIYIARPCQFTPLALDTHCDVAYWTDKRFSEEVIASVDQAIDKLTSGYGYPRLNLIGYSGGGAVAVLVAARRADVVSLRTVAGNLDHEEVNRLNDVDPLKGSLNAIDQARKIASLPQIHFSGGEDAVISPVIAKRFLAASEPTDCVRLENIPEASHEDGWIERWPALLKEPAVCGR
jgi:dienelactone hydrolase